MTHSLTWGTKQLGARRGATRNTRRAPREVAADAEEADYRRSSRRPKEQKKGLSSETARRGVSNPRRSIEDARLKPLHHPGKQALLDPESGLINKGRHKKKRARNGVEARSALSEVDLARVIQGRR